MLNVRNLGRRLAGLVASRPRPPSPPRPPSTASFETLDPSQRVEEETLSWYNPQAFYPVRIGEVFHSRYQVVGKLGHEDIAT
uniref:Cytochrome P450 monooxygenase BOT1 (Calcineurin-dependent protein 5)) n=1 Tax=Ganoderma boninense TaxID=34458 RepID=A0A5K1JS47_9APHY|nr:Cytochrome P450 monooxygenase BOT1 (EC (Botrydial biosynthesis cluster protein 1) (Calcineurin-dependent protein 5) [Ganoderma boninense]